MKNMLKKEMVLSASPLSYIFTAFSVMTMIPGYPILVGTFFVCLGIFQTFQSARENQDTLFTALLPIEKKDVVKSRYIFVFIIEGIAFTINAVLTAFRMTALSTAAIYTENTMMNANLVYLGFTLLIYGTFNLVFVAGFYKTAYNIGKPFVAFSLGAFLICGVAEALHHFPALTWLNATGMERIMLQVILFTIGLMIFLLFTLVGIKKSQKRFEIIDL